MRGLGTVVFATQGVAQLGRRRRDEATSTRVVRAEHLVGDPSIADRSSRA